MLNPLENSGLDKKKEKEKITSNEISFKTRVNMPPGNKPKFKSGNLPPIIDVSGRQLLGDGQFYKPPILPEDAEDEQE